MNGKRKDFARVGSAAAASKRAQISYNSSLLASAAATRIGSVPIAVRAESQVMVQSAAQRFVGKDLDKGCIACRDVLAD